MRPRSLAPILAAAAVLLTGCSGSESETGSGSSGLESALDRVSAKAGGGELYIEYGNTAELTTLVKENPESWKFATTYGVSPLAHLVDDETVLGMDLGTADYAVTVGRPPGVVTLVAGGQDSEAVRDTAKQLGYTGDPVLSKELDPKVIETVAVHALVTLEEDVALAGPDGDVHWIDSDDDSILADASVSSLAGCLGDPPAALLLEVDGTDVGVAIGADGNQTRSVLCLAGDQDQADAIVEQITTGTTQNGVPYSELFEPVSDEVRDGIVRVVLSDSDGGPADLIFTMAIQRDLPLG